MILPPRISAGADCRAGVNDVSGHDAGSHAAAAQCDGTALRRTISSWPIPREREDPGRKDHQTQTIPKLVGGIDAVSGRTRDWRLYQQGDSAGHSRLDRGSGRGGQDPGEHLPGGEHRAGQRDEDGADGDGDRRVGSDRRRQHQAVRISGVLSGPGAGRALHSHRSRSISPGKPAKSALPTRFIELAGEVNRAMPDYVVQRTAWH